jgi:hypothetical protein
MECGSRAAALESGGLPPHSIRMPAPRAAFIADFGESTLFGSGVSSRHRRNPMLVHAELDRKARLEPHHFRR